MGDRGAPDPEGVVDLIRAGDARTIARAITRAESADPGVEAALRLLHRHTGKAHVVGVTGPPGSGKSTLVDKLVKAYRERGLKVGVVAVDPSSPYTGGAVLGDRIRMQGRALDEGVFIRSLATRGSLGGLSKACAETVRILDAAGYERIVIETVGVGQSEVDIVKLADSVILVSVPGLGDDIQAIKAGVMEIGDVFVVNKADRDGADRVVREIRAMLETAWVNTGAGARAIASGGAHHAASPANTAAGAGTAGAQEEDPHALLAKLPPVLKTVAETGEGVEPLVDAIEAHRAKLLESGQLESRRKSNAAAELKAALAARVLARLEAGPAGAELLKLAGELATRERDLYDALETLEEILSSSGSPLAGQSGASPEQAGD
ncbi:MAG TPA: methylmalonyl Co-A mutase-associated GTPase MeaB [Spirochaetales bacterium]|nr:methylmalonyl Co-A mutase-associated GTPase MeaB [Spirochaetales bacterium]